MSTEELEGPEVRATSRRLDVALVVAGFIGFCALILSHGTALLEPDDYAYRASIIALSHGEILLTNAQYAVLQHLTSVQQWHHMASGFWISEKNPGYPFLGVLFYMVGLLRFTPLVFGAIGVTGLFWGANRWLGRPAGALAVGLYLTSGAALTFAWRATMPSFTDASLIAGGAGWLLWALLSPERSRLRQWIGLLAFICLALAVFIRYTNVLELLVAVVVVAATAKPARLGAQAIVVWSFTVGIALGALGLFDTWVYGHATATGYSAGEITFSVSALWPNLKGMPGQWTTSMTFWVVALASLIGVMVQVLRHRKDFTARRDATVVGGLSLGWLGLWFLYLNYTWTANMLGGEHGGPGGPGGGATVQVIRFYLPALGLAALVAAWLLTKIPRAAAAGILGVLAVTGVLSFHSMASTHPGGFGGPPNGGGSHPPTGVTGQPQRGGGTKGIPSQGQIPGDGHHPEGRGPDGDGNH